MKRIYVATSWKNDFQPQAVEVLRKAGFEVYDFRHPEPGNDGFHWRNTIPGFNPEDTDVASFEAVLEHPVARRGAALDIAGLNRADGGVMVLPCGNSAHLELGYLCGMGKPTVIWAPNRFKADLMYACASYMTDSLDKVVWYLNRAFSPEGNFHTSVGGRIA